MEKSLETGANYEGTCFFDHNMSDAFQALFPRGRLPPAQVVANQYTFPGLVGGTDGSAGVQTERMGVGFTLGNEIIPLLQFSAPVGGLVSSLRAEAASLLQNDSQTSMTC